MKEQPINKATKKSLDNLEHIINTYYGVYWESWLDSEHCTLSEKQIDIIQSYQKTEGHKDYASKNNLTQRHVSVVYNKAVHSLKSLRSVNKFRKWLIFKQLCDANVISPNVDPFCNVGPVLNLEIEQSAFVELIGHVLEKKWAVIVHENLLNLERQELHRRGLLVEMNVVADPLPATQNELPKGTDEELE